MPEWTPKPGPFYVFPRHWGEPWWQRWELGSGIAVPEVLKVNTGNGRSVPRNWSGKSVKYGQLRYD